RNKRSSSRATGSAAAGRTLPPRSSGGASSPSWRGAATTRRPPSRRSSRPPPSTSAGRDLPGTAPECYAVGMRALIAAAGCLVLAGCVSPQNDRMTIGQDLHLTTFTPSAPVEPAADQVLSPSVVGV